MGEPQRYTPDCNSGLSRQQVEQRMQDGLNNQYIGNKTKSYGQILKEHGITFFNILNIVLAALLLATGAYKDMLFLAIVISNFVIGIMQEIASKRTLDRLALIVAARVTVVRGGAKEKIPVSELVLDDVMELKSGDQICSDAIVLSGAIEVNESLISGESDVITKRAGDFLYSGSFVVAGSAHARVEHVGQDNYANKISDTAKAEKKRRSELYSTLGRVLRVISFIIIPIGVMLYCKQNLILGMLPNDAIVKTVAGIIGMIPEGLILLTSIAFVTSVIFLAQDKTLVQDMYGVETLARVETLCLDKTGTLTEGRLDFEELLLLTDVDVVPLLQNICGASQDENATMAALRNQFSPLTDYSVKSLIPFSSDRKYSGVCFHGRGTYILGAAEFILPHNEQLLEKESAYAEVGKRVILLAHSEAEPEGNALPPCLEPLALIIISDMIRPDANATLEYFYNYDVDVKIISGDNPKTVSYIAAGAGVKNADRYVDASTIDSPEALRCAVLENSVFGRVSPQQKRDMLEIMKAEGKKVAMMGDGVNDVLALKAADCSVAVASGSDAAKNISDIVLMDSNLKHLLHVVEDGRKIINNVQRVATLFITKTVYSLLLALATLFLFDSAYPFTPLQLIITSFVTIGAPAFFLALEPQYERIKGSFMRNVLQKSLPGGLAISIAIILANALVHKLACTQPQLSTMCVYIVVVGGMCVLLKVSQPLTLLRKIIFFGMIGVFAGAALLFPVFFEIYPITPEQVFATVILSAAMPLLMWAMEKLMAKVYAWVDKTKSKRKMVGRVFQAFDDE